MTSLDDRTLHDLSAAKRELLMRRLRGSAEPRQSIPVHPDPDRAPLAPAQRAVWILDHYLGRIGLYNIDQCLWLDGPLDPGALGEALDDVIERHQVLRASTPAPGVAIQVFGPARPGALAVVDLTAIPVGQRQAEALDLATEAAAQSFDLASGPLIRAMLLRLAADRHLLVLTLHHLVGDERSMEILQDELAEGYAARLAGRRAVLPALPAQYRDYAAWQAAREIDDQLAYWRQALDGLPAVLDLPADAPRRREPTHRGDLVHIDLSDQVRSKLTALADRLSCTTFAVLLSGFAALMHRYSGQDKIAVGTLLAGRDHMEVTDLIGLFARPAALVADFAAQPSFADLVVSMHQRVGQALAHQDVSFEQVVEAVRPDRDLSANPLFQVLYQQEDVTGKDLSLPGLRVRPLDLAGVLAKVDLTLFTRDDGHVLGADLVFATDLFSRQSAGRMLAHFGCLLADAVTRHGEPVSRLRLLSPAERATLLFEQNETAALYPREACLHELFEAQADRTPDAIALAGEGISISYAELDRRANRLARHLRDLGVRTETPVGVCLEQGPDMFVALLGVLKAGGAYVPADPSHPADRLAYVLADTAAAVVITQASLSGLLRGSTVRAVRMDTDADVFERYSPGRLGRTSVAENLVYVMYTSGSTGRPKGVMISHRGLNNYLWWAIEGYGLGGAHGAPMVGSIAFDLSVPNFFLPLIAGRDVTLLPADRSQQALAELLLRPGDFSLLKITPAHLDVLRGQMLSDPQATVTSVRTFVIGADEVKPETIAGWRRIAPQARLINEYGPTETVVGCSIYEVGDEFDPAKAVSIGRPIANMTMYVLDKHLEPVPPGVVGELYIGGDGVARGYLGRPALTADRFLPDPYGQAGARFYRTGDLARVRPDGNFDFLGRTDHQVKIRGYRIELGEIEAQLLLSPAVREAVVAVRQDRQGAKKLVAYVVPATAGADPAALRDALRALLPDYMVPATFVLMDALPLSEGGKVDRRLLPEPAGAGGSPATPSRPRTDSERTLARLWAELLDLPSVDVGDNFFEIGGDSLLAIQLSVRARSERLTLTPRLVFQHQTLEELAAVAEPAEPEPAQSPLAQSPLAQPERAEVPMSPSQLRLLSSGVRHEYHIPVELVQLRAPAVAQDVEQILHELVARHQALRLRVDPLTRRQHAVAAETARLLRSVNSSDAKPAEVAETLRADLDLASGPLLRAALIKGDGTHRLMLAAHHFAVDGVSWQILLDELAALWPGASREPLPPAGLQFSAWTSRLHAFAASAQLTAEAPYWLGQEPGISIPLDISGGRNTADTARTITTVLSAEQTRAMQRGSRARTSDLVFSAVSRVLSDWAGGTSATVEVSGHGRDEIFTGADPARTVGWLSCGYPVTLRPSADRDPLSAVAEVSRQLREVPRSGIGYGLLRYLRDDEIAGRLAQIRTPDVVVNYEGRHRSGRQADLPFFRLADAPDVEAAGAGARTHLLQIGSAVVDGQLTIGWTYCDQAHREGTIARLAGDCLGWLRSLARQER